MRLISLFITLFIVTLSLSSGVFAQEPGTLVTIAGGGSDEGENIPATDVALNLPLGISLDAQGNIYIADSENHRIRRVDITTGNITTIAGNGEAGFAGDGGPATQAQLNRPNAVAVDDDGTIYIGDTGNFRIRRVDTAGNITTIAGTGERGFSGDGGPALEATFFEIKALLVGGGVLFISDGLDTGILQGNNRVRQIVLSTGQIGTIAGNGSAAENPPLRNDISPILARIAPEQLAFGPAPDFNIHIADFNNGLIRRIYRTSDTTSAITTAAGRLPTQAEILLGTFYKGDGGPANQALFFGPTGVVSDVDGNLYIADSNNQRIRVVEAESGNVYSIAGTGLAGSAAENQLGLNANLNFPVRLLVDANGDIIFIDAGTNRILKLYNARYRTPLFTPLTTDIVDFNRVSFGDPITRTITLENRGNLPVTIQSSTSNNSVFRVSSPLPLEIGAHQIVQLEVVFEPQVEGVADGLITITTNDPRTPSATFEVTGIGEVPEISLFPDDQITFDRTFIGQTSTANVRIANIGAGILVVRQVVSSDNQFLAQITDPIRINSGQNQNLSITFRPTQSDTQRATLTLFTNVPTDTTVTINVQGIGQLAKPGGFVNVAQTVGVNDSGAGFGASWADVDNDGDSDLYVVRSQQPNRYYRNDGNAFTEIASSLGIDDAGDGSSAIWGDVDLDGDLDLYVTNFSQPNRYYRNDGNTFTEIASALGINDEGDGHGSAWADADADGDLDLYVTNFGANRYYRNDGNSFTEYTDSVGLADNESSIQPAWGDYDNDGDPDLFLANSGPDKLFRNDGGRFTLTNSLLNPIDNGPSFGAAWGDYENDGDLDLFVTHFNADNRFYINDVTFIDNARNTGLIDAGRGRGVVWADFDNDGYLDLYISNSGQPNLFYRNIDQSGLRAFVEEADTLGVAVALKADSLGVTATKADSRGVAIADYNNDGSMDIYVAVQNEPDFLFQNQEANGNWIVINPVVTESRIDAIGMRVELSYNNGRQAIREISSGTSYLSQNARNILVGVSDVEQLDQITLRWPSGIVQQLTSQDDNLNVNQVFSVTETRPLPPTKVQLLATTNFLTANGVSETELTATVLNNNNKRVLVQDRVIQFRIETGSGILVGEDSIAVKDGIATIRYRSGTTAGLVTILAESPGLTTGRTNIELIAPIGDDALTIRTVVGSNIGGPLGGGFEGDGGLATEALLQLPRTVLADSQGNIYVGDTGNNRIRKVDIETSIIQTVAGNGDAGGIFSLNGDNGPPLDAPISAPQGLAFTSDGDLLIGESGSHTIRRVFFDRDSIITIAGTGIAQFGGDSRPATEANLRTPLSIATDRQGNLYIADSFNRRIRKVDTNGIITTVAGSGSPDADGFSGDGGAAIFARLSRVSAVAVDSLGRIFIADTQNNRVRMVDTNGIITTVAGTGIGRFSGDGGPATQAEINAPQGLAIDSQDNLYIADTGNHVIRLVNLKTGIIQTVAGTQNATFDLEEGGALAVSLNNPTGLAISPTGTVLIADRSNHRIRELSIQFDLPNIFNPPEKSVDFNADGQVDFGDFLLFVNAFGNGSDPYDLNNDGLVNLGDFILFANAFENNQTVVRP